MTYRLFRLAQLTTLAVGLHLVPALSAQPADELKARLLTEAPPKWEEYRSFAKQLQGKAVWQTRKSGPGQPVVLSQVEEMVRQNARSAVVVSLATSDKAVDHYVFGTNPKYAFRLTRQDPSRGWLLERIATPDDIDIWFGSVTVGDLAVDHVSSHFSVGGLPIAQVCEDAGFAIKEIGVVQSGGRELVRVEFSFRPRMAGGRYIAMTGGRVLLDPAYYWHMREAETTLAGSTGTATGRTTYDTVPDKSGRPILRRTETRMEGKQNGKTVFEESGTGEFDLAADPSVPDTECTLTAFGLPEPVGVEWKRPTPLYVWLLMAAGVCGGLAYLFFYLRRRSSRTGTT